MNKDLGIKDGELLIFGGIYSNLHALKQLKLEAEKLNIAPNNIICTGDIVAYCAYPEECIQFVKDWGIHCIAGNVEYSLREDENDCGCNFSEGSNCDLFSKKWFPYAKDKVSQKSIKYLKSLPEFINFKYNNKKYSVIHGSYFNTSQFIFKSTDWTIKADNFKATSSDVILSGHCGIPFVDQKEDKLWLNAGVIGMPANDGNTHTWYLTMHENKHQFRKLIYDHNNASKAMLYQNLPKEYAQTLIDGIWDNCDILPEEETSRQGMEIGGVL